MAPVDTEEGSGQDSESDQAEEMEVLEPWPDFLRRVAQWTEEQLDSAGLLQWTAQWRRRQWKWAAKLVNEGSDKWSNVATAWQPLVHSSRPCGRRQARPRERWEQDFVDYISEKCPGEHRSWQELAKDTVWWMAHAEHFLAQ